jgi:hypothetical protein
MGRQKSKEHRYEKKRQFHYTKQIAHIRSMYRIRGIVDLEQITLRLTKRNRGRSKYAYGDEKK